MRQGVFIWSRSLSAGWILARGAFESIVKDCNKKRMNNIDNMNMESQFVSVTERSFSNVSPLPDHNVYDNTTLTPHTTKRANINGGNISTLSCWTNEIDDGTMLQYQLI